MQHQLLLPSRFKTIGWFILVPAAIAGIILSITGFEAEWLNTTVFAFFNDEVFGKKQYFSFIETNVTNTFIAVLFIIGAMLVSFSKEKNEDEFIANIRLSSLLWAVLVSYILLLLAFIFVYGMAFLNVMIYNMFTVLIIFIIRFNYLMYKNAKTATDEK